MGTVALASHPQVQLHAALNRERRLKLLCALLAVFIAVPVLDVPFIGLSLSAPVLALIAMELFLRSGRASLRGAEIWMIWGSLFWAGMFLSLAGNVFQGNIEALDLDRKSVV
jgi:hypothetical protein